MNEIEIINDVEACQLYLNNVEFEILFNEFKDKNFHAHYKNSFGNLLIVEEKENCIRNNRQCSHTF